MRTRVLPAILLCLASCSRSEPPRPQTRARAASVVEQGQPIPIVDPNAVFEVVDVQLRTGRTRVGEAVRLHVSAWRASDGPGFEPEVTLEGPATIERVGDELVEERDGRVRERVDFRIEPTGSGTVSLSVLAAAPLDDARSPGDELPRHDLTVLVGDALAEADLARQLGSAAGRLERGRMLAKQGDYRRAIEIYNRSLEQQRDDPVLLSELGWAAFLAGDHGLARRATREGLRYQQDPAARGALLYNLGRIAEAVGRDEEAIAAYRRSLEVRPGSDTVRERLAKLEAARPTPSCAAPSCPLASAVDPIRACELIEEEACPLVRQPSACHCDADALAKLDAIGPWRLWTLTQRQDDGLDQVFVLLASDAADEPRYQVFAPLPGSHFHGELRGGIRAAELVDVGELELLRIDFDGTVSASSLPSVGDKARRKRAWTVLCLLREGAPVCAAPLLTRFEGDEAIFEAPLELAGGSVSQTASGAMPSREELDLEFPGAGMHVLVGASNVDALFADPAPDGR